MPNAAVTGRLGGRLGKNSQVRDLLPMSRGAVAARCRHRQLPTWVTFGSRLRHASWCRSSVCSGCQSCGRQASWRAVSANPVAAEPSFGVARPPPKRCALWPKNFRSPSATPAGQHPVLMRCFLIPWPDRSLRSPTGISEDGTQESSVLTGLQMSTGTRSRTLQGIRKPYS